MVSQLPQFALQRVPHGPLFWSEGGANVGGRDRSDAGSVRGRDLLRGQRAVIEPRFLNLAGQEPIAGPAVPQSEQHLPSAGRVGAQRGVHGFGPIRAEVWLAVAVHGDSIIAGV